MPAWPEAGAGVSRILLVCVDQRCAWARACGRTRGSPTLAPSSIRDAILARDGQLAALLTLAADEQYRLWIPLSQIATPLRESVLLYEDRHFYAHFAVNVRGPARARRRSTVRSADDASAASTR